MSITDLPVKIDKTVIEADIAFQNVDTRAKQSLESVKVGSLV